MIVRRETQTDIKRVMLEKAEQAAKEAEARKQKAERLAALKRKSL